MIGTHDCNDVERHEADGQRDVAPTRYGGGGGDVEGGLRGRIETARMLDSIERIIQHCPSARVGRFCARFRRL